MFAEELGGNASRRKQEEARARRRKLKQQQEQKKKAEERAKQKKAAEIAEVTNAGTKTALSESTMSTTKAEVAAASGSAAASPVEFPASKESTKNTAVAKALQQRQERQQVQLQLKSAIKVQSFYRAHRSNTALLQQQMALLAKRLQDLSTLTTILSQQAASKGNPDYVYVPPPATTSALCQQLLFLTKSFPYKSKRNQVVKLRNKIQDANCIQQLVQLVLLPGLYSHDENANPFLVWIQTKLGKLRFQAILRVLLVTVTTPNIPPSVPAAIAEFLQGMTGTSTQTVPAKLVNFGISELHLLASLPPPTSVPPKTLASLQTIERPIVQKRSSLDLIALLRYHLLYGTGGPEPIPKSAEQVREACISTQDRAQADGLFRVVLNAIRSCEDTTKTKHWYLRFVAEILTVPLLSWKVQDSLNLLLATHSDKGRDRLFLITLLETFASHHAALLNAGDIGLALANDTALSTCPATNTQCLLANLLQIGRLSTHLNGNHLGKLDFCGAAVFYEFLATLLDAVPLATLTSRESVVEWISDGKGHHSPVVLSTVIMEQCKYLLGDSFVRKMFACAIDMEALQVDMILQQKTDKDKKQETALQEAGGSAASLAAKEARVDRSKGFWNSSAWAKKITKGVSKMLAGDNKKQKEKRTSKLINATEVSRQLAQGEGTLPSSMSNDSPTKKEASRVAYTSDLLVALCRVFGVVLSRWGGGGGEDIVRRNGPLYRKDIQGAKQEIASSSPDPCTQGLLNTLIFSTNVISASWALIQSDPNVVANVYSIIDPHKGKSPVRSCTIRPHFDGPGNQRGGNKRNDGAALLFVFVSSLSHVLIVTDDTEIHEMGKPLPLHQLRRCIQTLKQLLYRACCLDERSLMPEDEEQMASVTTLDSNYFGLALIHASARAMRDLYDRSSRRPLSVPKLWLIDDLLEKEIRRCKTEEDYVRLLSTPVLRVCPFLVSFKRRLKLFERIVSTNRVSIQGENSQNPFHTNPLKAGIPVRITRGRILEDGLATMNNLGRNMRQRLAVQYYNEAGMRESGIDVGGLFKEFWTDLCAIAFDPNYALFKVTEEHCMYPNPASGAAHGSDHIMLLEFLGRILGKALYEGITVHPQFAHFFLSHLRGDYNYLHMLADLSTMDSQLYNNIMFLKTYDGDAEDLCLTFTVANDDFGGNREIPLLPNGSNIEVTNLNKQRYIGLVAKYYVVDRIKEQSEAFTRGLREVIDKAWLKIFNEPELQVLISGASDGKIDVDDLRSNCRYAGGFTGIDRTVNRFWSVMSSLDSKQQANLLRFVTSCERPPPLGFASMNPPFTIQRVGIMRDGDKLPTSSTCFNVLKLPTYSSEKVMKERLLYAIESGAGFELT